MIADFHARAINDIENAELMGFCDSGSGHAKELAENGARLIDVREPSEFQEGHLDGAVNIPLEWLSDHRNDLSGLPLLLYCSGGIRSQMGTPRVVAR